MHSTALDAGINKMNLGQAIFLRRSLSERKSSYECKQLRVCVLSINSR